METSLMSESVVDATDVEDTVTQVLKQFVQDGDEPCLTCQYNSYKNRWSFIWNILQDP